MNCLMQNALGHTWETLPAVLKAHYRTGDIIDMGELDIHYPRLLQPYLDVLHLMGALVNRRGSKLPTVVDKSVEHGKEYWRRTITYPDGKTANFTSFRIWLGGNELIEFVNSWLGLQMTVRIEQEEIVCEGIRFVMKIGPWHLPIPEWLALGHTTIREQAIDDRTFGMDFRMKHPLFGEIFRYAGRFHCEAVSQQD